MGFGLIDAAQESAPVAEINTTPLVDVMLVLLIIFIVTAPLMTQAVRVDLPRMQAGADPKQAKTVTIEIASDGTVWIDARAVNSEQLRARLSEFGAVDPQPALRLQVDRASRHQALAEVLAAAQAAGLTRLGFITDPRPE